MDTFGTKKRFKSNEVIMQQGDDGDSAYIIEDGTVEISITNSDGTEVSLGRRGAGSMIGEMALVDSAPRSATVTAIEPCKMYEITKDDFAHRLDKADPILKMTIQVILTRYRDMLARAEITRDNQAWPPAEAQELDHLKHSEAFENIKLANELEMAIENQKTQLYYQPIVDIQNGVVKGFEALMRWEHEEQGFISPAVFIPVAEESGLILKASQWALKESCAALQRMEQRTGIEDLFMSVNFSGRDFASDGFVDGVYDTISRTDLAPSQIHIEITERMLIGQPERARETLDMCAKAGMGVALDDFGTGYSSLSYLRSYPIDTIKIDRSFITEMEKDETSIALIKSIIALGKNLNMEIVAEGVETQDEALMLKDMGCEMVQGYYFCRPINEIEVTQYLIDHPKIAV